jgi:hypothetical protein
MRMKLVLIHIDANYVSVQLHAHLKEESIWHTTTHVNDLIETVQKVLKASDQLMHVPMCKPVSYRSLKDVLKQRTN